MPVVFALLASSERKLWWLVMTLLLLLVAGAGLSYAGVAIGSFPLLLFGRLVFGFAAESFQGACGVSVGVAFPLKVAAAAIKKEKTAAAAMRSTLCVRQWCAGVSGVFVRLVREHQWCVCACGVFRCCARQPPAIGC
jgi:hypothetical protein